MRLPRLFRIIVSEAIATQAFSLFITPLSIDCASTWSDTYLLSGSRSLHLQTYWSTYVIIVRSCYAAECSEYLGFYATLYLPQCLRSCSLQGNTLLQIHPCCLNRLSVNQYILWNFVPGKLCCKFICAVSTANHQAYEFGPYTLLVLCLFSLSGYTSSNQVWWSTLHV